MKKTMLVFLLLFLSALPVSAQTRPSTLDVKPLSNISALRAANPSAACMVFVSGYYSPGDGGGGVYVWQPNNTDPDNGGSVIKPTANTEAGRWVLDGKVASLEQFGAIGDARLTNGDFNASATNNLGVLRKAFQSGIQIVGTRNKAYYFQFDGTSVGFTIASSSLDFDGQNCELITQSGASGYYVFNFKDASNVSIENLKFTDIRSDYVYDVPTNTNGADLFVYQSENSNSTGLFLKNVSAYKARAFLQIVTSNANTARLSGITLQNCYAEYGLYGINCANNGDNLFGDISTSNMVRSYFVYGVKNHKVSVSSYRARVFTDALIKCYGRDTANIDLTLAQVEHNAANNAPVSIEFQDATASSTIKDITLRLSSTNPQQGPMFIHFGCFNDPTGITDVATGRSATCTSTLSNINIYPYGAAQSSVDVQNLGLFVGCFFKNGGTIHWHGSVASQISYRNSPSAAYPKLTESSLGGLKLRCGSDYYAYQLASSTSGAFESAIYFDLKDLAYPTAVPFYDSLKGNYLVELELFGIQDRAILTSNVATWTLGTYLLKVDMVSSTISIPVSLQKDLVVNGAATYTFNIAPDSTALKLTTSGPSSSTGLFNAKMRVVGGSY